MRRHDLHYDLALFPTLTGTGMISGSLKQYHPFYGHYHGRLPAPKVKRETPEARIASK
jgi:hypothetical protein